MTDDQTQHAPVDAGLVDTARLLQALRMVCGFMPSHYAYPQGVRSDMSDDVDIIRSFIAIVATGGAVLDPETVQDILWLFSPEGELPFDSRQYQERKARILAALPKEAE
jgi:hypothetical protein